MEGIEALINVKWTWNEGVTPFSDWYYPVGGALSYLLVCRLLQLFMKSRNAMTLNSFQVAYNIGLILLSLGMFLSIILFASVRAQRQGLLELVCEREEDPLQGGFGLTIYVFHLSKYIELVDTMLLILRKKPVIFLHVYHHMIMIIVTWSWFKGKWIVGAWCCVLINSLVHMFMYYYFLRATLGHQVWWKKYLTLGQIIQFFTGFGLMSYWLYIRAESECRGSLATALLNHFVNFSFIVLFILFFRSSYSTEQGGKKAEVTEDTKKGR